MPPIERTTSDRHLLAVSGVAPWPMRGGFSLRAARLLELMASDWTITLITACRMDREAVPLDLARHDVVAAPLGIRWTSVPRRRADFGILREALEKALATRPIRAALLFNGTEFLGLDRSDFPPTVVDRVDCGALERLRYVRRGRMQRRFKAAFEAFSETRYERRIARAFEATVVAGEDDREALIRISGTDRIHVVPNGVDALDAPDFASESPEPTVAFTGTLSYYANADAIVYFARRLWPTVRHRIPDARLLIAGRNPSRRVRALEGPGVEVRSDVPDMSAVLAESWVTVAPMLSGTGVKNKVLEAWAVGRPAVLTPIAANGLALNPETRSLVAREPDDFCRIVISLLQKREERHRFGSVSHELARTHHTWKQSADAISRLLEQASQL